MRAKKAMMTVTILACLVAGLYWYKQRGITAQNKSNFEEIQQVVEARQKAAMARPVAAAFQNNDVEFLVSSINEQRPPKEMEEFFNDAIFALDRDGVSHLSVAGAAKLRDHTFDFLTSKKSQSQSRGPAARARTLAIRVLGRLPAPPAGSAQYKRIIDYTRSTESDPRTHFPMLEYIATWKPFPREVEAHLLKKVYSDKRDESIFAINIISRMTDMESAARLSKELYGSIASVPKNNQPFVVKMLATSAGAKQADLSPLVQLSQRNFGDPAWEDVYVSIFEQNPEVSMDRRSLSKLMESSNNPLLKQRIGRLLASVAPKGGKGQ